MANGATGMFSIGGVIQRTFAITFRNIVPFGVFTALLLVPAYIISALIFAGIAAGMVAGGGGEGLGVGEVSVGLVIVAILIVVLISLVTYWAMAGIIHGTFQDMRGQGVRIGDCVRVGWRRALPTLGVVILLYLAIGIPAAVVAIVLGLILPEWLAAIVALIVGAALMLMMWAAIPVAVVEKPGVVASMSRSITLTKGYRWHILAILFVMLAVAVLIALLIGAMTFILGPTLAEILQLIAQMFFTVLFAVLLGVSYYDLRASKEGIGVDEIAAVFD